LIALRHELHKIPELGFEETETSDLISTTLDNLQIPYQRGLATTGVVATLKKGNSSSTVLCT